MTFKSFGFNSGKSSLVVDISLMSKYVDPGMRGPSRNLIMREWDESYTKSTVHCFEEKNTHS